jgi:hypothetical protein
MLCSLFSAIFAQFLAKKLAFFLRNQCHDQIFGKKLAAVGTKNDIFLAKFLVKIFLKS